MQNIIFVAFTTVNRKLKSPRCLVVFLAQSNTVLRSLCQRLNLLFYRAAVRIYESFLILWNLCEH